MVKSEQPFINTTQKYILIGFGIAILLFFIIAIPKKMSPYDVDVEYSEEIPVVSEVCDPLKYRTGQIKFDKRRLDEYIDFKLICKLEIENLENERGIFNLNNDLRVVSSEGGLGIRSQIPPTSLGVNLGPHEKAIVEWDSIVRMFAATKDVTFICPYNIVPENSSRCRTVTEMKKITKTRKETRFREVNWLS